MDRSELLKEHEKIRAWLQKLESSVHRDDLLAKEEAQYKTIEKACDSFEDLLAMVENTNFPDKRIVSFISALYGAGIALSDIYLAAPRVSECMISVLDGLRTQRIAPNQLIHDASGRFRRLLERGSQS
jgi:hypothetical protein